MVPVEWPTIHHLNLVCIIVLQVTKCTAVIHSISRPFLECWAPAHLYKETLFPLYCTHILIICFSIIGPSRFEEHEVTGEARRPSKLLDGSSELALTYEDREGDWMLVGDVPWGYAAFCCYIPLHSEFSENCCGLWYLMISIPIYHIDQYFFVEHFPTQISTSFSELCYFSSMSSH